MENKMKYIIIAIIAIIVAIGGVVAILLPSTANGEIKITDAFGQLQEDNKYMVYYTLKNVNLEDLENAKYKVNVEYYVGNKLLSTVESDNWLESGDYEVMADAKYISTEKIDKAVIKLTDESGTLIQSKDVQFEDTTSSTNSSQDTNQTTESSDSEDTSSASGYQVKIIYDGSWAGAVATTGSTNSYDGTGDKTIDVTDVSYGIVSANAQKQDGSSNKITIQILKDGEIIKEGSTTAAYGVAQISIG
jgi:hypothetical protein